MRVILDTNVLVDAAVHGRPYHREAVRVIHFVEQDRLSGVLAPLSLGTLRYLGTNVYDTDPRPLIQDLARISHDKIGIGRVCLL